MKMTKPSLETKEDKGKTRVRTQRLINRTRRPVTYFIGGKYVRLGPQETSDSFPEDCARQPHIHRLCSNGTLAIERPLAVKKQKPLNKEAVKEKIERQIDKEDR